MHTYGSVSLNTDRVETFDNFYNNDDKLTKLNFSKFNQLKLRTIFSNLNVRKRANPRTR